MKLHAGYILNSVDTAYSSATQRALGELLDVTGPAMTSAEARAHPERIAEMEILLSSWGGPTLDEAFLQAAPRLKAVFYAAGSIKAMVTEPFWGRAIPISSAWAANAVPVAEFTLAQVIFALKHVPLRARAMQERARFPANIVSPGAYGGIVGLIGLGMIGRLVAERLRTLNVRVLGYDPTLTAEKAATLHVELRDLDALFREGQVISLHAPSIESTRGMIHGRHFEAMPPGATFINTARGAIVREMEMISVLQKRPDLSAFLDVTDPEPPAADSPLYTLPNVFLTPHLAGSLGHECRRMGDYMLEEVERYLSGKPLRWSVSREASLLMA